MSEFLERCQCEPVSVGRADIDALFEHKMFRTIVEEFFPIPPNQVRTDYYSFLVQSVIALNRDHH